MRHCETQLLFLSRRQRHGARPGIRAQTVSQSGGGRGCPRLAHRRAQFRGPHCGVRLPPASPHPSPPAPSVPPSPLWTGIPPPPSKCPPYLCQIQIHLFLNFLLFFWPKNNIYLYIYYLNSISQGSPNALSTSCDKTTHASFETHSSSIQR